MASKRKIKVHLVGAGEIGLALAAQLSLDGCAVTVVDTDDTVLKSVSDSLDVICFHGNGASYAVLQEISSEEADVFIAVTDSDELNVLACLTAHVMGAKHTVARVRDIDYAKQASFYRNKLGLSFTINPELAAAREISRLLRFPAATRVEVFAKGRAELVEMTLTETSPMCDKSLMQIGSEFGLKVLICAVVRGEEIFIPQGHFVLHADDILYLSGSPDGFRKTFRDLGMAAKPVRNVLIAGAGRISYYLTEVLQREGVNVTIVEKSHTAAVRFCRAFPACSVMNDDALAYFDAMSDADIRHTDAFIALTGNNEYNVVASMYANSLQIGRIVSQLSGSSKLKFLQKSDHICSVSQEDTAVDIILGYTRSLMNADDLESVESLYRLMDGRIEFIEFRVTDHFSHLDKPLHQWRIQPNTLIACIMRGTKTIIPRGNDVIHPGDSVLVATLHRQISRLEDVLAISRPGEVSAHE